MKLSSAMLTAAFVVAACAKPALQIDEPSSQEKSAAAATLDTALIPSSRSVPAAEMRETLARFETQTS